MRYKYLDNAIKSVHFFSSGVTPYTCLARFLDRGVFIYSRVILTIDNIYILTNQIPRSWIFILLPRIWLFLSGKTVWVLFYRPMSFNPRIGCKAKTFWPPLPQMEWNVKPTIGLSPFANIGFLYPLLSEWSRESAKGWALKVAY